MAHPFTRAAPLDATSTAPTIASPDGYDIEFSRVGLDKKGNATVLWSVPTASYRLDAASRPVGGSFAAPVPLDTNAFTHDLIFDKKGNALAYWRKSGELRSSFRPVKGSFDAASDASEMDVDPYYPSAAFDNKGNALLLWNGTTELRGVEKPAGSTFGLSYQVSATNPSGWARPIFDKKGNLFVAWTRLLAGFEPHAVYATRSADGVWSVENDLAAPTVLSIVTDVAMDAKGNVRVIWTEYDEGTMTSDVATAYRPTGGTFAPVEYLANDIPGLTNPDPKIVMDKKGNAVAVWVQNDGGIERVVTSVDPAP